MAPTPCSPGHSVARCLRNRCGKGPRCPTASLRSAIPPTAASCAGVGKTYRGKTESVEALRAIDFVCNEGEFVCLLGRSGCGKSTLLQMIAGLEKQWTRLDASARQVQRDEERARRETEERLHREAEARREVEARERREAEEKSRREAEERLAREAQERTRLEAELTARLETERRAREQAEREAREQLLQQAQRAAQVEQLTLENKQLRELLGLRERLDSSATVADKGKNQRQDFQNQPSATSPTAEPARMACS